MTKGLKYGALSFVASALLSTSATAGTIYGGYAAPDYTAYSSYLKASELTGKLTGEAVPAALLGLYVPSDIVLTTLSNPTFNYVLSAGKWHLDALKFYYIVETATPGTVADGDKIVGKYTSGDATSTIAFGATGPQVSNTKTYVIVEADEDVAVDGTGFVKAALPGATDLTLATTTLPAGITFDETTAGTQTLTIKLGQGDSQNISDIATATFLSSEKQLCASVTQKFDNTIDPNDGFKSFLAGAAAAACGAGGAATVNDDFEVTIKAENRDIDAVDTTDTAVVRINVNPALPAGTTVSSALYNGLTDISADCSINAAGTLVTCTADGIVDLATGLNAAVDSNGDLNGDITKTISVELEVPGTIAIARTAFTADVDYDFVANTLATDYLETANNALLLAADAGVWAYNGTTLTAPSINSNADTNQMVKLNNDSTTDAKVFWTLTDDAGNTVSLIEVASANGGAATLAAGTSATWLASDLKAAAQAVNASFGEKFRGSALVTTTGTVTGVTVMMINGGRDRVLPLD